MLDAALDLAGAGWKVLPCIPAGPKAKAPLTPNGFKDATTDPGIIRAWWEQWPAALIGVVIPEHLLVLDIDPRNGGSMAELEQALGALPDTLTSWSGRGDGGCHMWFHSPTGRLSSKKLPQGVDLKLGGRGYCIAPPSPHPATGTAYRWDGDQVACLPRRASMTLRAAAPPRALTAASTGPSGSNNAGLIRFVSEATQGQRNDRLFWAACRAFENGNDHIIDRLFDAALTIGLSDQEAARTISSAKQSAGGATQ